MTKPTTKKPATKASSKTITVICPHCGEDFDVKGNGRYICPDCDEYVDVDLFDTPHVHQPDNQTCGWATAKWLLTAFGCNVPTDRQLERELHVRKSDGPIVFLLNKFIQTIGKRWDWQGINPDDIDGTLPVALVVTLMRHGLKPVFPGFRELLHYSSYKDYMKDVFSCNGRFALVYVNTTDRGSYAHWIGIEKYGRSVRVMDPVDFDYSPFSMHEAIRGKRIRVCCMIGFVRA